MYKRIHERENDGSGEIQRLDRSGVHYLGTGPKAFISAVHSALERALEFSLVLYIPHTTHVLI